MKVLCPISLLLAALLIAGATSATAAQLATVSAPPAAQSIFDDSGRPSSGPAGDSLAVELGVRLRASTDGWITAIRYYKYSQAAPSDQGTLWSSNGSVLARADFDSTSGSSGWQTASLDQPVHVDANTVYVASYTAPKGHYAADQYALSAQDPIRTNQLTALAGVYSYSLGFPSSTWHDTNYYADVDFVAGSTSPATTVAPTTTTAAPTTTTAKPTTTAAPPTTAAPTTSSTAGSAFPSAASTGVPANVALKPSGSLTITTPGTVIDSLDISGTVSINASNVTIKRSRISGEGFAMVWIKAGLTGIRVEDSELNGEGSTAGSMGVIGPATVLRSDIYGVENGVAPFTGSTVQDNFIHGLSAPGSPHYDGIQIDGDQSNIAVSHNTVDLTGLGQTSAVMIDNYFGPTANISVDGNRLLGAGYTVYSDGSFSGGSINGVSYTNNRLGKGYWGYDLIRDNTVTWSGNVDDQTGAKINQ